MAGISISAHGARLARRAEVTSHGSGIVDLTDGKGAHDCITLFFDHPAEADEVANEIKAVARKMRKRRVNEKEKDNG